MSANQDKQPSGAANPRYPIASTIDEALPLLRRPFSPSAVRVKVQNQDRAKPPNWGQIARYIDARLVSERLNLVVGGQWSYEYAPLDPALRPPARDGEQTSLHVVCSLTVLGQCHTDVGEGRDPKAAFSDALKRAAVPFGIGRSIYAIPRRFLLAEESKRPPRDKLRRKGERLYLTDANELLLREEYEQWLAEVGIAAFGEPLDHGPDDAGAEDEGGRGSEVGADASPVGGGLRAVSSGEPSDPPATIHERRTLSAVVANGAYQEETVKQLAGLVFGERLLDRLSRSQMVELERMLERASAAAVTDAALAERLRRADQQRDSAAVEAIGAWLREPAPDAVGEGERRAA